MTKKISPKIKAKRLRLKLDLIHDKDRKVDSLYLCEGQGHLEHNCSATYHLNEVLFPRQRFQKLPALLKLYFFNKINCSIVCDWFHRNHGHSRAYREYHEELVRKLYTDQAVDNWIENAPLKIKTT